MFIIEEIEIRPGPRLLSLTMFQRAPWTSGRVEAGISSNPEAIDPQLVQLAKMVARTASPKLEAHRKAVLWEEEIVTKTLDPDILSWLMWSFRRERPDYGKLFETLPIISDTGAFPESDLREMEDRMRGLSADDRVYEITSSFSHRELVDSPLPVLPDGVDDAELQPIRLRIAVTSSGRVRFVIPEGETAGTDILDLAIREVRKWRFKPIKGFEEDEPSEEIEWGWVIIPWVKEKAHSMPEEEDGAVNTGVE